MEKMDVKVQAKVRADLYEAVGAAMKELGYETEPFAKGMLVHLPDGYFAKVNVAVANAEKFDLEEARSEYADLMAAREERARLALAKAEEKARKAAEKAAKAQEKATN